MATLVVTAAGLTVWSLLMVVVVQRQRVLGRRLARIERRLRADRSGPLPAWGPPIALPRPRRTPPSIQQLAALGRPLSRFGG